MKKKLIMFKPKIFGRLPTSGVQHHPDYGKQLKTLGLNILNCF